MEDYQIFINHQQSIADDIEYKYTTFQKLPLVRRNVATIESSLVELEAYWGRFHEAHTEFEQRLSINNHNIIKVTARIKHRKRIKNIRQKSSNFWIPQKRPILKNQQCESVTI